MPLHEGDFRSIRALVERMLGQKGEYFTTGTVIKRDELRNVVWLEEFGDQAIPLVAYDYEVKYYDASGAKLAKVRPLLPKVGQTVVVARELGSRRLPRLIGILRGTDWISTEED